MRLRLLYPDCTALKAALLPALVLLCMSGSAGAQGAGAAERSLGNVPAAPESTGVLEPQEGSVMFSEDDSTRLKKALEIYDSKVSRSRDSADVKNEDDFLAQLLDVSSDTRQRTIFPYFFLSSIVYISPREWIVFINDHRITPQDLAKTRLLSVVGISKTAVKFKWHPFTMPEIKNAWRHRQSLPGPFSPVALNAEDSSVFFTLKPNQTFFSRYMEVVEGKLPPHLPPPPPITEIMEESPSSSVLIEDEAGTTVIPLSGEAHAPPTKSETPPAVEPGPVEVPAATFAPPEETPAPTPAPEQEREPVVKLPASESDKKRNLKSLFEDLPAPDAQQ